MGFKAIAEFSSAKHVQCRNCGHEWDRPPVRELRREAERRIDERYAALDVENERLRRQLADYLTYQRDIDRGLIPPPEPEPLMMGQGTQPVTASETNAEQIDPQGPGDLRNSLTPGSPHAGN
jgi:hypothetical protein